MQLSRTKVFDVRKGGKSLAENCIPDSWTCVIPITLE